MYGLSFRVRVIRSACQGLLLFRKEQLCSLCGVSYIPMSHLLPLHGLKGAAMIVVLRIVFSAICSFVSCNSCPLVINDCVDSPSLRTSPFCSCSISSVSSVGNFFSSRYFIVVFDKPGFLLVQHSSFESVSDTNLSVSPLIEYFTRRSCSG